MRVSITTSAGVVRTGYSLADNVTVAKEMASDVVIWCDEGVTTLPNTIADGDIIDFHADRVLNFSDPSGGFGGVSKKVSVTGINIINDLLFWTDNYSEPKKIDIKRCKAGSKTSLWSTTPGLIGRYTGLPIPKIDDFNQHTVLVIGDEIKYDCIKDDLICGNPSDGYEQTTEIND